MRLLITFLLCTGLFTPLLTASIHAAQVPDTLYGFDPTLYNGRHYTYSMPRNAEGTPFLYTTFTEGVLIIRDKVYAGVDLNLDLLNQVLVMKYTDHRGAMVLLEIPDTWLTRVRIGTDEFIPVVREGGMHAYDQVIGDGGVKFRYALRKDLKLDNRYGSPQYVFSRIIRTQYAEIKGKLTAFRNNRSLVHLFDESVQSSIVTYLKNNKIKVSRALVSEMSALAGFCQKQQIP
jgi:hypothetical protein